MPSLLDLSTELLLEIIAHIESSSSGVPEAIPAAYYEPLTNQAIVHLSRCCKTLREVVAPTLFCKLRLRNNVKSGRSVQAVASSPWASRVQELHFEALMTIGVDADNNEDVDLHRGDYPSSVHEILSHLEQFPRLETLTVRFTLGNTQEADQRAVKSAFLIWLDLHDRDPLWKPDELLQLEGKAAWRALMAKTYDAISNSALPQTFSTFEMRDVLPAGVSTFTTEAWQSFSRSLKTFRFHLCAIDVDEEHGQARLGRLAGYTKFANRLHVVFQHLDNATDFRFSASSRGPIGLQGLFHAGFYLHTSDDMPFLQVFELHFCFISEHFADFIGQHLATLKRVVLTNCYSPDLDGFADEHTTWESFFNMISEYVEKVDLMSLEEVTISPSVSRVLEDERDLGSEHLDAVAIRGMELEVESANQTLRDSPGRKFFAYAGICSGGGCLYQAAEENLWAFLRGDDEAAFDRLMAAIERRRDRPQSLR